MTEKRIEAAAKADYEHWIESCDYSYEDVPRWDDRHPRDIANSIQKAARTVQAWLDAGEPMYVNRGCRHQPACDSLERVVTP